MELIRRIATPGLMFLYLYTLTFDIFMTNVIRLPSPLVFVLPLIFLNAPGDSKFRYTRELIAVYISSFFFFLLGQEQMKPFFVNAIIITLCAIYFNYFIGNSRERLKLSVWIFYGLLAFSAIIMLLNHAYGTKVDYIRSKLVGEIVMQSPSGIAPFIFNFGYQLTTLVSFLMVSAMAFRKHLLIQVGAFAICILLILYGMNRSVLIGFAVSAGLFALLFYRIKFALILAGLIGLAVYFNSAIEGLSANRQQNILSKQERKADENRDDLMIENLKIIADYPFGLMVYGKSWNQVARYNPTFQREVGLVTSHNAYLMFVTYLGILPGLTLLILLYFKVGKIFIGALRHIKKKENALLLSLCCSFTAAAINSCFHNDWFLGGNGPTVFLYFCIIQLARIQTKTAEAKVEVSERNTSAHSTNYNSVHLPKTSTFY